VPAVSVEKDRPITDDVVEVGPGGEPAFGQPLVVDPLSDDRALDTLGEPGHPRLQIFEVGRIDQLQPVDQGCVTQRVDVVVVVGHRRCCGIVSSTI
jgi:hypothetical protein